jgi:DNA gyrase subunit A
MAELLIVTQRGYGKRVSAAAFSAQAPGGKGVRATIVEEEDAVAAVLLTEPEDDVIILTAEGRAIRVRAMQVRSLGRDAVGSRLIKLPMPDNGAVDRVVAAVVVPG